jgi:hypothetical protein
MSKRNHRDASEQRAPVIWLEQRRAVEWPKNHSLKLRGKENILEMSDVLIHVNETIADVGRFRLEESLRDVEGVVAPRFSAGHDHLMFVAYDSNSTSAAAILGQIHKRGYGAQIVAI